MKLAIPGPAVTLYTDGATGPGIKFLALNQVNMHKINNEKKYII